ncbi:MAG TPA: NAD(P)/FAD-dependent oxidoreductase [Tepidisphaeraceae bacterium]|jgi:NADH dehydrogenase
MKSSHPSCEPIRILILGGGFGGMYAARRLQRAARRDPRLQVTLVSRDNFFLFTPMLHEVAASDLEITHIVSPVRSMLPHVNFFCGEVDAIDLEHRRVRVSHGFGRHAHDLEYDHLLLGLGSVTNFFKLPGVEERAVTMKSLGDAIGLRNRLISLLEEADTECAAEQREGLMTVVVAGGGFSGVETIGGVNDFIRDSLRHYPHISPQLVRMVVVHPGDVILPELGPELGAYAQKKLAERGIEIRTNVKVARATEDTVMLSDGTRIPTRTLIWTAGTAPHPIVGMLPCQCERGRICANEFLEVPGRPGVWALGDCAVVPDLTTGRPCPPTAQHACRQGHVAADNILAAITGGTKRPFRFKALGQLAAIGHRAGVARILGVKFSGFPAWWIWRSIYLSKLPTLEKRIRVAIDWTLDLIFSKDLVQFLTVRAITVSHIQHDEEHGHAAEADLLALRSGEPGAPPTPSAAPVRQEVLMN